jgi:transcriptional regulator with XRE-family HTH domain
MEGVARACVYGIPMVSSITAGNREKVTDAKCDAPGPLTSLRAATAMDETDPILLRLVSFNGYRHFRARRARLVTPQAFGEQLRRHREKRHITLPQIADRTKVSVTFLRSLEAGNCAGWPGGIYSRGFVRAYAAAIGLDPEEAVSIFAECYPAAAAAVFPEPPAEAAAAAPQTPMERVKAAVTAWFRVLVDTERS